MPVNGNTPLFFDRPLHWGQGEIPVAATLVIA